MVDETNKEPVQRALDILVRETCPSDQAALVSMPPDSKSFLTGNSDGYIQLAIAALKASQGEKQKFKDHPWFVIADYDYGIAGLDYDENAHIYLPKQRSHIRRFLQDVLPMLIFIAFVMMAIVGAIASVKWLLH